MEQTEIKINRSQELLRKIRNRETLKTAEKLYLTITLSLPAMLAQVVSIIMQYIDAAMVGHLGEKASASIGLVSTSTWLIGGTAMAAVSGFSIQVAQEIGAKRYKHARELLRQSYIIVLALAVILMAAGLLLAPVLPKWLGGTPDIVKESRKYFTVFSLALPIAGMSRLAGSMLQASGNMKVPGLLNSAACILDIIFNAFFIFDTADYKVFGMNITVPGLGLGVTGAALGSAAAELVVCILMYCFLWSRRSLLSGKNVFREDNADAENRNMITGDRKTENRNMITGDWKTGDRNMITGDRKAESRNMITGDRKTGNRKTEHRKAEHRRIKLERVDLRKAWSLGWPIGLEHIAICGAMVVTTVLVAPLGNIAIAANSFAITAESLCYMPGYGIGDAAATLVGQSVGAGRKELAFSFGRITIAAGMVVMTLMGVVMYCAAPLMIGFLTPVKEIKELGTTVLRIEAFAEPLYAASIVAAGALRGAGDTFKPFLMNLISLWAVRLGLAFLLTGRIAKIFGISGGGALGKLLTTNLGLEGIWIAMCVELCFRGAIFLIRFHRRKWMGKAA